MSEGASAGGTVGLISPGRLLREARQAQGLHIAALATSIKVTPHKLELLETDRFDELPDATFTRALAQTVCRVLKIDPAPVLRLLPPLGGERLGTLGEGLNAPFRERPGQLVQKDRARLTSPALWGPALVLLAAAALYLTPSGFLDFPKWRRGAEVGNATTSGVVTAPSVAGADGSAPGRAGAVAESASVVTETLPSGFAGTGSTAVESAGVAAATSAAPSLAVSPAASMSAGARGAAAAPAATADLPAGVLQLRASSASWIDVTDAHGQSLMARLMQPGETVGLEGSAPFKVRIGNASGTELVFRGRPMALAPFTRDNVARIELK